MQRTGDAEALVKGMLDQQERLMGFGHRVYRAEDPRARVRETSKRLPVYTGPGPRKPDMVEGWTERRAFSTS